MPTTVGRYQRAVSTAGQFPWFRELGKRLGGILTKSKPENSSGKKTVSHSTWKQIPRRGAVDET
jgi:hypothetical protein